jgi:hypothetical protein
LQILRAPWSRHRSVCKRLLYRLDDGRIKVTFPAGATNFLFSTTYRPVLGPTQSLIQWVPWTLSPEIKRLGGETDHSLPSSAEVKNGGAISSLPYMFSRLSV